MRQRQLLTLSGIASVILLVLAFGVSGDSPGTSESGAQLRAFYVDHSSGQRTGAYLLMIAVPLLIFFAAAVRSALVDAGAGEARLWGNIFFTGAVVCGAGLLLAACLQLALATAPKHIGGDALQALNALSSESYPAFTGGLGVLMLGAAGAMIPIQSGLRWLGWVALVLGIVIFTPLGFFGFAGAGLWIVLTSVAMTMRLRAPRAAGRVPVAANSR
jgi:hypothetical protein